MPSSFEKKKAKQFNKLLNEIQTSSGFNTVAEAADYVLLHYNAFDPEFVDYCEELLLIQEW